MAPVKPMGVDNPKTRPGVTGFVQEYNQEPGPRQELNPEAVADPAPAKAQSAKAPKAAKATKATKK